MAAPVIGVFVHNGAGWQRANGGTPTGYSGVHVYSSGWKNCNKVEAYTTSWKVTWVDVDGELSLTDKSLIAFDVTSPFETTCEIIFESDGDFGYRSYNNNSSTPSYTYGTNWRSYDCGRNYELQWSNSDFFGTGVFTVSPALAENTWTSTGTTREFRFVTNSGTNPNYVFGDYDFIVYVRDADGDTVADDSGSYDMNNRNGNL